MAEKDDYLIDMLVDLGFVSDSQVDAARAEAGSADVGVDLTHTTLSMPCSWHVFLMCVTAALLTLHVNRIYTGGERVGQRCDAYALDVRRIVACPAVVIVLAVGDAVVHHGRQVVPAPAHDLEVGDRPRFLIRGELGESGALQHGRRSHCRGCRR